MVLLKQVDNLQKQIKINLICYNAVWYILLQNFFLMLFYVNFWAWRSLKWPPESDDA